jgi:hypothetical protein
MTYANEIASALEMEIKKFPDQFYDSFRYTTTGQNLTHPLTLGLLTKVLWQLEGVKFVAVDFRLNDSGAKFQPDLVALSCVEPKAPLLYVDYESPNSCDTRIPTKDVAAYIEWSRLSSSRAPYIIVTTLPANRMDDYQLRYASKGSANYPHKYNISKIRDNPYAYWYGEYKLALKKHKLDGIWFININGKTVKVVPL